MAEVVREAQQDFWRPPTTEPIVLEVPQRSSLVEVCGRCEAEFIAGSRFCHRCGAARATAPQTGWQAQARNALRHLEFHNVEKWINEVRHRLGLPTASLIAFVIGLVCSISAITMGLIFTVQTTLDWQALQLWRMEWLLGALVAFVAGILLKKSST